MWYSGAKVHFSFELVQLLGEYKLHLRSFDFLKLFYRLDLFNRQESHNSLLRLLWYN